MSPKAFPNHALDSITGDGATGTSTRNREAEPALSGIPVSREHGEKPVDGFYRLREDTAIEWWLV